MKLPFLIPESYHPQAKEYLIDILKQINKDKAIKKQDLTAFTLLGDYIHIYCQAREILLRDGIIMGDQPSSMQASIPGMEKSFISKMRNLKPHPALKIAADAQNQIIRLLIEFNLTPRSRKKTVDLTLPLVAETEYSSPIDKFMKKEIRNGNMG